MISSNQHTSTQSYSNVDTKTYSNIDTRSYSNIDTRSYTTITDNNGTRKIVTNGKPIKVTKVTKKTNLNSSHTSLYMGLSIFALVVIIVLVLYFNTKKNQVSI